MRTKTDLSWRTPTVVADNIRDHANLLEDGERLNMTNEVQALMDAWDRWMKDRDAHNACEAIIDAVVAENDTD